MARRAMAAAPLASRRHGAGLAFPQKKQKSKRRGDTMSQAPKRVFSCWPRAAQRAGKLAGLSRAAAVLVAGLAAVSMAAAQTKAPAKVASADHIRTVTRSVDGAFIETNAAKTPDWPSYGLDYAETRFS